MRWSRSFQITLFALAICVGVVSVWYIDSQLEQNAQSDPIESMTIGVAKSPLTSPFFVAQHLGLFAYHGLNIELIPCIGGNNCVKSMLAGELDYATASESVAMFESFHHDDLALLVSFVESNNDVKLLTLASNGISHIGGLRDKRIGVVKGSASEFYLDSTLIASNLANLPIEKVDLLPNEMVTALLSKQVDAISAWEPFGYLASHRVGSDVYNLGVPGVYQLNFNLLSQRSTVERNMAASTALILALDDAINWIHANPVEAQRLVAETLQVSQDELEWTWDDYLFRLSLGSSLLSNLQLEARWALQRNLVTEPMPNFRELMFSQPYQVAFKQRINQ
ncbi:ABC transporter substrate-binding protein [Vibrio sp.]|uniref:ABC transporter substrate-binding protein n=1 Tax=Vibrio sp. TaxID=678 RepID=UPI003D0C752B